MLGVLCIFILKKNEVLGRHGRVLEQDLKEKIQCRVHEILNILGHDHIFLVDVPIWPVQGQEHHARQCSQMRRGYLQQDLNATPSPPSPPLNNDTDLEEHQDENEVDSQAMEE
ncbi:hypothetical protein SUGI_0735220 [Cryptomeria japonica]|nr:hypothetical protein SUGI_0735220 [Cryptomeria japonica]